MGPDLYGEVLSQMLPRHAEQEIPARFDFDHRWDVNDPTVTTRWRCFRWPIRQRGISHFEQGGVSEHLVFEELTWVRTHALNSSLEDWQLDDVAAVVSEPKPHANRRLARADGCSRPNVVETGHQRTCQNGALHRRSTPSGRKAGQRGIIYVSASVVSGEGGEPMNVADQYHSVRPRASAICWAICWARGRRAPRSARRGGR